MRSRARPTTSPTRAMARRKRGLSISPTIVATCLRRPRVHRRRDAGHPCSRRLAGRSQEHRLPLPLLTDLLSAFEQDVRQAALQRPRGIARLLPPLGQPGRPSAAASVRQSTGLRPSCNRTPSAPHCSSSTSGRTWASTPAAAGSMSRLQIASAMRCLATSCLCARDTANVRALIADMVAWTSDLMRQGAPLAFTVGGSAGWELRLVVQGGTAHPREDRTHRLRHACGIAQGFGPSMRR